MASGAGQLKLRGGIPGGREKYGPRTSEGSPLDHEDRADDGRWRPEGLRVAGGGRQGAPS